MAAQDVVGAANVGRLTLWERAIASIYLAGCAYGFAHGWINVYQLLACKAGLPVSQNRHPLPLTRDYMYENPSSS